jgi:hypothetical protein
MATRMGGVWIVRILRVYFTLSRLFREGSDTISLLRHISHRLNRYWRSELYIKMKILIPKSASVVSLLAVIGESSMEAHSHTLTASWTCMLPRIIPAPQALLKPSRPTRLPQTNSAVVGVHNGTLVNTFNYFPNIMHPLEDLKPLQFKVLKITHKNDKPEPPTPPPFEERPKEPSGSTSVQFGELESGITPPIRRRSTFRTLTHSITGDSDKPKPRIPPQVLSPLNILSVGSCLMTIGVFIAAVVIKDGTACVALGTISLVSSIVGYASWWSPVLTSRTFRSKVPPGDIAVRTREGAFLLVRCNENVARELYVGTEECLYYVGTQEYRSKLFPSCE